MKKNTSIRATLIATITLPAIDNKKFYGKMQQSSTMMKTLTFEKFENTPLAPFGVKINIPFMNGDEKEDLYIEIPRYMFGFDCNYDFGDTKGEKYNVTFKLEDYVICVEALFTEKNKINFVDVTFYDSEEDYNEEKESFLCSLIEDGKKLSVLQDENVQMVANDGYRFAFLICENFLVTKKEYKILNLCSKDYCRNVYENESKKYDNVTLVQAPTIEEMNEKVNLHLRRDVENGVPVQILTYEPPTPEIVQLVKVEEDDKEIRALLFDAQPADVAEETIKKELENVENNVKVTMHKAGSDEEVTEILINLYNSKMKQGKKLWVAHT